MNIIIRIFGFLFFQASFFAQNENVQHIKVKKEIGDSIYFFVEKSAYPQGKDSNYWTVQFENLVYPQRAINEGITGRVYITCVIEKDGSVTNVFVLKGIPNCSECDAEAKRVVEEMDKWVPAQQGNQIVRSKLQLPISFTIQ